MQDVVGQIVVAGGSLRQSGDIQPVRTTLLKIGTPVNPCMADEEEEGPKEDPLGPLMQNLRKMKAEEESAKVEGKPKKRAKNKISSAPEPSTTSRQKTKRVPTIPFPLFLTFALFQVPYFLYGNLSTLYELFKLVR